MNTIQAFAVRLARGAGNILMEHFNGPLKIEYKGTHDVVTQADKAAENYIIPAIIATYPHHHVVGEEGGSYGASIDTAPYRWYVDPLDGTTNFASGIPHFCVSIGLADKNNNPIMGVIYNPNTDELFTAIRGQGAYRNGMRIDVSANDDLNNTVLVTGFPYDKHSAVNNNFHQFAYFASRVRGIRRFGSAALDLCWVAMGRIDGYWEWKLNRWDFFGGMTIVREAGGKVTDFDGNEASEALDTGYQVLATNGHIHQTVINGLHEATQPTP